MQVSEKQIKYFIVQQQTGQDITLLANLSSGPENKMRGRFTHNNSFYKLHYSFTDIILLIK